jgi:hemoglobin/transferrin/lactoferrin receptor protein
MWGGDVANKSHFGLEQFGSIDVTYGMSYLNEATKPIPFTDQLNLGIPSRNGNREEVAGFGKVAYKPVEWLTLNGGLRYSHYSSQDRSVIANAAQVNRTPSARRWWLQSVRRRCAGAHQGNAALRELFQRPAYANAL